MTLRAGHERMQIRTWVATFNNANLPFLETVKDIIGWSSWTLKKKQKKGTDIIFQNCNLEPSDKGKLLHTCFCLLGPQSCNLGSAGVCRRRERSDRHSYTRGTAHAHLPTTPAGFRQDPVRTQTTNHKSQRWRSNHLMYDVLTYTLVKLPSLSSGDEAFAVRVPGDAGQAVLVRLTHLSPQFSCLTTRRKKMSVFTYTNSN